MSWIMACVHGIPLNGLNAMILFIVGPKGPKSWYHLSPGTAARKFSQVLGAHVPAQGKHIRSYFLIDTQIRKILVGRLTYLSRTKFPSIALL
jgi:hypothetical protein